MGGILVVKNKEKNIMSQELVREEWTLKPIQDMSEEEKLKLKELEANLWQAADKLRVDSGLKASEYSTPILGLIFLRFASIRYNKVKKEIAAEFEAQKKSRLQQKIEDIAILKCGFYLPKEAEYDYLLQLPEKEDIAKAIKKCGDKLVHVQLSENDRSTVGKGHIDFKKIIKTLKSMNYKGMVSIEAFSTKLAAANIWRPMFKSETQLMQDSIKYLKKLV